MAIGTADAMMTIGGGTMMIGAGVPLVAIAARVEAALDSAIVPYLPAAGSTMKLATSLTHQREGGGASVGAVAPLTTMVWIALPQRKGMGKIPVVGVAEGAGAGIVGAVGANEAKVAVVARNLHLSDEAGEVGADPGTDIDVVSYFLHDTMVKKC